MQPIWELMLFLSPLGAEKGRIARILKKWFRGRLQRIVKKCWKNDFGPLRRPAQTDTQKIVKKMSKNGRCPSQDHLNTIFTPFFALKWGRPSAAHPQGSGGLRPPLPCGFHFRAKNGVKMVFKWSSLGQRPFFEYFLTIFGVSVWAGRRGGPKVFFSVFFDYPPEPPPKPLFEYFCNFPFLGSQGWQKQHKFEA